MTGSRFIVVGGAGFIGSHFVDRLLAEDRVARVTVYDNFSSGREWHIAEHRDDPRLRVVCEEVRDLDALRRAMAGHDTVIHLASNPDIARAVREPSIDFDEGTLLTHHVVEAARVTRARRILYASGSGVYGDLGEVEAHEDRGPLLLICSYCHLFDLRACAFRFGNVVGPRQTHGVGFDFVRHLLRTPERLTILGDGTQSKSYIHVHDVVEAVLTAAERTEERFQAYNVATGDYITVREIAEL